MLAGAPVVYDKQQDIRQLLIDEVQRVGTLRPEDYFTRNWRIEPASVVAPLYAQMRADEPSSDAHASGATHRARRHSPRAARHAAARSSAPTTSTARSSRAPDNSGHASRRRGVSGRGDSQTRRAECVSPACETLLVDGGDQFQGTPASNFAYRPAGRRHLQSARLRRRALGNHEFDWGQDTLRARMRDARYAFLGANVRYADGRDVPWIRDDTLITRGRLKVGVIGLASVLTPTDDARVRTSPACASSRPHPIVDSLARRLARARRGLRDRRRARRRLLRSDGGDGMQRRDRRLRAGTARAGRCHRQRAHALAGRCDHQRHARRAGTLERYGVRRRRSRAGLAARHRVRDVRQRLHRAGPGRRRHRASGSGARSRRSWGGVSPTVAEPTCRGTSPQYPLGNLIADAMRGARAKVTSP